MNDLRPTITAGGDDDQKDLSNRDRATMRNQELVAFLQWALPRLRLRWEGFRKVRRQVGKRLGRRLAELKLNTLDQYRDQLQNDPAEWSRLDELCHITISCFYRDKGVFDTCARSS